jgi:thiamine biosynthesis lipoprotein
MVKMQKNKWFALAFVIIAALVLLLFPSEPKMRYYHHEGKIFGTYYNIRYEGSMDLHNQIQERLASFDASLSMFNQESVIARINRNEEVCTDSLFERMYHEAQVVSRMSDGAFDITVAPLVNLWGFGLKHGHAGDVSQAMVDSVKAYVGYEKVELVDHRLQKDDARITLDASAIAKGYGTDVVADVLREAGCENYLVEIGGEVVLRGVNDKGQPWRVGISRPKMDANGMDEGLQHIIQSSDLCLATSGNYLQYYYHDGQRRSHTIDPRTGYPVQHGLLSATVVASSCMRADALATACMVLGEADALTMIEQTDDAACYLIVASGDSLRITVSNNWKY